MIRSLFLVFVFSLSCLLCTACSSDDPSGSDGGSAAAEICDNSVDDDGDNLADCDDSNCDAHPACGGGTGENCNNGVDDDGDSLTDCQDFQECATASNCIIEYQLNWIPFLLTCKIRLFLIVVNFSF